MRILVLNNYDLVEVGKRVASRQLPDHLLYGVNHFVQAGHQVKIAPLMAAPKLARGDRLLRRSRLHFFAGNIEQQVYAWVRRRSFDVIYAPCQTQTQALGLLRKIGLLKTPLVVLAHHPYTVGRMNKLFRSFVRAVISG